MAKLLLITIPAICFQVLDLRNYDSVSNVLAFESLDGGLGACAFSGIVGFSVHGFGSGSGAEGSCM